MGAYATPTNLRDMALPPDTLFGDQGLQAGYWTEPALVAGSGLGSVTVWSKSNPWDAFSVRVQFVAAGECNQEGYVNQIGRPGLRVSLDNGVTYSQILKPDNAGFIKFKDGGFGLQLVNGSAGAPVTIGSGNASLVCTPLRAGASVSIVSGSALSTTFRDGALVLTVASSTTAAAVVSYLAQNAAPLAYIGVAAGGDGSGIVQPASLTLLPFSSFTSSDVWTFTTQPSPDVLTELAVWSDHADGFLCGTYNLPLTAWGNDLRMRVCQLVRWALIVRRGLDKAQDMQVYHPKRPLVRGILSLDGEGLHRGKGL